MSSNILKIPRDSIVPHHVSCKVQVFARLYSSSISFWKVLLQMAWFSACHEGEIIS